MPRPGAPTPPTPMTVEDRARLGGLTILATHGPSHMARIGAAGQDGLSRRIAAQYGIPEDAPDYLVRLEAARRLYFTDLRRSRARGHV